MKFKNLKENLTYQIYFSDFQWNNGLRIPYKWDIYDDKNRDCGYMDVKEIRYCSHINKKWYSQESAEETMFDLFTGTWKDKKNVGSSEYRNLQRDKMLQASVNLIKKIYVVDDETNHKLNKVLIEYRRKIDNLMSAESKEKPENMKRKEQLFKEGIADLKSISKNLKKKKKLPVKLEKLIKSSEKISENWKKPEWALKQYTSIVKNATKKVRQKYNLTDEGQHNLEELESETIGKLKDALKTWPKDIKETRMEIGKIIPFFDRRLKEITNSLQKKNKQNEEKENE